LTCAILTLLVQLLVVRQLGAAVLKSLETPAHVLDQAGNVIGITHNQGDSIDELVPTEDARLSRTPTGEYQLFLNSDSHVLWLLSPDLG
jgi:hypothetical protein